MKILHVITSLDPAAGGPPMIAARLAAGQASLGHAVRLVTYQSADQNNTDRALLDMPHFDQVAVSYLPAARGWDCITGADAHQPLACLVEQVDAVHLHSVWDTILRIAANVSRDLNKPYCVLLNGMLDPWCLGQKAIKKKIAFWLAYRRMLNGAAFLHLGNIDERNLIQPLRLTTDTHLIPNGVFLEEIDPPPQPGLFYAKHPELNSQPYILFLSRLHHKKGLDYLAESFIRIASKHPSVQLVVAGPDDRDGSSDNFQELIAQANLSSRVHVIGPVYGRDKYAAMVDAACFCLPSRQEGFSMAITEALACGAPAVISENCHFPQVAEVGAGEVARLNASAVAQALDRVLSDPGLRERMGQAGRQLVAERFTWQKIAAQTIALYEKYLR